MYDRKRLIELVKEHALQFGDFTLASGKKATYYLDCRKLTLDGESANVIAEGILDLIGTEIPDAVGGMAIGADPITASVITLAWQKQNARQRFHRSQGSQATRYRQSRRRPRRVRANGHHARRRRHDRRQFTPRDPTRA